MGLAILFSFGFNPVSADPGVLYVNHTSGNDDWDGQYATWQTGTIFGPKLTIKNATGTVNDGGTVNVASGTYNENGITINKNINIVGENKYTTIINGTNTAAIFAVSGSTYSTKTASFSNLKMINGKSMAGGAIQSNGPNTVIVENCIFQDNVATGSGGGAIYSYGEYSFSNPGQLSVIDSTFTNNQANGGTSFAGSGGAIANFLSTLTITNSNFINNAATGVVPKGGAIHNSAATGTIQFNRFIGNTATTGSAIYSDAVFGSVDATLNWWGSNNDPTALVSGPVTVDPWLVLTTTANSATIGTGGASTVTADLQHDSWILLDPTNPDFYYHDPVYGHVPDGIVVNFATGALGTVNPLTGSMVNGAASTTFTAGQTLGLASITSSVDAATATSDVNIVTGGPPAVTTTDPVNNAVNVPLNKVIKINFNKAIKLGLNPWIEFYSGTTNIPFTATVSGSTLSLTPNAILKSGLLYNVIIHSNAVTSLVDIGLAAPYGIKFTTETGPVLTTTDPANNAVNVPLNKVVKINFNKSIKLAANPWIEFFSGTTNIPFTATVSGSTLNLTPKALLASGKLYQVIIHSNSVTTLGGAGLAAPYSFKFTAETGPTVTSTDPANNAVNVPLNKVVKINFNKSIKLGTNPWIEFKTSSGTAKAYTATTSGSTLSLKPNTNLTSKTVYNVIIHSNAVTTLGGAGLASPYTLKFTTA